MMMMMFISVFATARMMLLFYVAVVFASKVIMFEYGFDVVRRVILLYVAVLFSSELHSSEWDFDAAIFRTVQMKFTSGKTVTLHNVLHVPTISKSLVSVGKLDEHGFKMAIESRKVVITKRGLFVGKGYYQEGMYRLNVENESPKNVSDSNITTVSKHISHVSLRSNFDSVVDLHVREINQISVVYPGEALLAACHIHNRITSCVIPMSPYELWNGRKLNLDYLRVWGCLAYYRTPEPKRSKLGARGIKSVFVGYAKNSKAYRLLDENSGVIIESRDVEFFEDKFSKDVENPCASLVPTSTSSSPVEISTEINEPRRKVIFSINIDDDPKTFSEAMSSRDAPLWKEAVNDEMDSILGNWTWELAELPKGVKPIGSKWVFKKNLNPDGLISAFKARLVAKGYRQREGLDYFDTYAPVAKISSIRTLIAISAIKGLYIHQMDVKTAFLNGYLHEEVYMEQPEGFVIQGQENKVCRLVKYLYGLKQAPKQWHESFCHFTKDYPSSRTLTWEETVSWAEQGKQASKKQTCISHSTTKAEFIALAAAGKEAEWMRDLLLDI
ncbi:retrovirus-related pol polyprotein from transposon TNT 1-94 [Tanacetum coccineum]